MQAPEARSIFADACALPPEERDAYLAAACAGDPSLRAAVAALLDAHDRAETAGFLDRAAIRPPGPPRPAVSASADTVLHAGATAVAPAEPPPVPAGRYVLGEEIARGGMGVVYRATDTALVREVAVKVLRDRFAPASGTARRFADEARITGQLQHPGVPPVHDLGTLPDGRPFLAMKLIKGETLADLLAARPNPAADRGRFVAAFEQVCQAVAYAHAHGVIHRDLKPANVMVGAYGEVQVMDWGLAKVLGAGRVADPAEPWDTHDGTAVVSLREGEDSLTVAGSVLGTPAFMPPEQAVGAVGKVDARSDVFGLGAVLAVVLTGHPPFIAESAETTRVHAAQGAVADCFARLDACGAEPELVALCKRCLSPAPAGRPADAGEVARAVAGLRQAADERARRAELDRVRAELRAAEQRKRRRVQAALGLTFTALVVLGVTVAGWRARVRAAREAEVTADQAARQSRTTAGVTAALRDTRSRVAEAWAVADYPARMQQATAAATVALSRADPFLADAEPTPEVAADLAAGRAELADLDRHTRLVTDLARNLYEFADKGGPAGEKVLVPANLDALRRFGLDPVGRPESDVARAVAESRVRDALLAVLLDTAFHCNHDPDLDARLLKLVGTVRRLTGGHHARWQELLDRNDVSGLVGFAATPEALSFPPGLIYRLGHDLQGRGHPAARRDLLRSAVARYPHDVWLHYDLASACLGMKPPTAEALRQVAAEALRHAAAAAALRPDSAQLLVLLGRAYAQNDAADHAIAVYREVLALDPTYTSAHSQLGLALKARGDLGGAAYHFWKVVRLRPEEPSGHAQLGAVMCDQGQYEEAVEHFREAVRLGKNNATYQRQLDRALQELVVCHY